MSRTFVIADTHFGDPDIIRYENRPFKNVDEMNKILIENWNHEVGHGDTVFVLGDFAVYNDITLIRNIVNKLRGRKILVMGNHDSALLSADYYVGKIGFESAVDYPIIYNDFFILSHEPVYINSNMPYANIFGHVHSNPAYNDVSVRSACVSVERTNYRPVNIETVIRCMRKCGIGGVAGEQTNQEEEKETV